MPAGWVTADEADGGSPALRGWLEARQLLYVLAVKATEPLPPASGPAMPAARLAGRASHRTAGCASAPATGAKGRLEPPAARRHWRAGRVGALAAAPQPDQRGLAYYVGAGPAGLPLIGLVRVAGARWRVGRRLQAGKGLCGLDQHQVAAGAPGTAGPPWPCWRTPSWWWPRSLSTPGVRLHPG